MSLPVEALLCDCYYPYINVLHLSIRLTQVPDEWQRLPGNYSSASIVHGTLAHVPAVQMAAQ